MSELLKKLAEGAKSTQETPAPFAKDTTGYFAVTRAVERPNFLQTMEPEDSESVDAEHGEDAADHDDSSQDDGGESDEVAKLRGEVERLTRQHQELLAGSHRAGQIDNETLLDAERYRALQRERKTETVDPEVESFLKELDPKFRKAFDHLARTQAAAMVRDDPEIKRALETVKRVDTTVTGDMQRKLEAEVAELDKYVPRSSIPQDVQAQVVSLRRNPAFANKTVLECYELVVGKKVRKPSPPTSQKVSSARTTSARKPPTKDFNEALRRAMQRTQAEG